MTDRFNQLTPAQDERLSMLAEECAEVIQAICKIKRHGYASHHPDAPSVTNADLLAREICDLRAVMAEVLRRDMPLLAPTNSEIARAWEKKLRFAHHQGNSHE